MELKQNDNGVRFAEFKGEEPELFRAAIAHGVQVYASGAEVEVPGTRMMEIVHFGSEMILTHTLGLSDGRRNVAIASCLSLGAASLPRTEADIVHLMAQQIGDSPDQDFLVDAPVDLNYQPSEPFN